jgi:hypothetical protein
MKVADDGPDEQKHVVVLYRISVVFGGALPLYLKFQDDKINS